MQPGLETYGNTIENTKNPTQHHLKAIWQRSTCLLNYLRINSHNLKPRTSLRLAGRWQQAEKQPRMNKEKWNEICYLLSEKNFPSDLSETDFGQKVIQALRILDWKEYKGEIEKEHSLQFGSVNKL